MRELEKIVERLNNVDGLPKHDTEIDVRSNEVVVYYGLWDHQRLV